jgi:hypothetical protein
MRGSRFAFSRETIVEHAATKLASRSPEARRKGFGTFVLMSNKTGRKATWIDRMKLQSMTRPDIVHILLYK